MARYTVEKDNLFISADTGPLTQVIVTDLVQHVTAIGYAKLNLVDQYDEQFGIDLATSRAYERLYKKVQRKLIKSLDAK